MVADGEKHTEEELDLAEFIWDRIYIVIINVIKLGKGTLGLQHKIVHQIVMEKIPWNNNINKLRRINKYKAEYDMILKYFWPQQASVNMEKNVKI